MLVVALSVILLDNLLGVSFHYRITNKMDELAKVNSIIQNPLSDSITKSNAIFLRQEILTRENVLDYLFSRNKSTAFKIAQTNKAAQIPIPKESIKNFYIFIMSSGGLIALFGVIMAFVDMIYSDEPSMILRFVNSLSFFVSPFAIGVTLFTILNLVPMIGRNWYANIVLNSLIQTLVLSGIILYFIRYYQYSIGRMKNRKEALEVDEQELGHS
jgi:hypothetical protein